MDNRLSLDELIDKVINTITLKCKLPQAIDKEDIELIIEDAQRWFYKNYKFSLMRTYYYVDILSFLKQNRTGVRYITLPDEIESIRWIYMVNYKDMQNLGYLLPRNSLMFGQTTQPFVAAINVGEFAQSVSVMQTMQDALSMFAKNTVKNAFNPNSKRFEVQTSLKNNLILEVYAQIEPEALYGDPLFIKYVTGMSMIAYSLNLSFLDMQLAGNTKISTDRMNDRGEKMVEKVVEDIKKITSSSFFFNKTR